MESENKEMNTTQEVSNNPSPAAVESNAKNLTGEQVLKHIIGCREDTKDVLKKVPYRISKNETFQNVLSQIKNDQDICIKYIDILQENLKTLDQGSIGNLPQALEVTKNRLSSEKKMVEIMLVKNPFGLERTDQEIKANKLENLYALNAYASMSRAQEEVEWDRYKTFSESRQPSPEPVHEEKSEGLGLFSVIVICFIVFVVLKRSQWAKNALGQVLKSMDGNKDSQKDKDKDPTGGQK